jgi:prepilin-type N-terminal cleavage/methylation domain-containing protein
MMARSPRLQKGFTVAELITVCAIIAVLSAIALPVARFGFRRQKELDLRERLRKITEAIDYYHDLRVGTSAGQVGVTIKDPPNIAQAGYPKDLDELVKGVELTDGRKIRFLRERDTIDPMTGKKDWVMLCVNDDADKSSGCGDNVFEVHSSSTALSLDGKTHYNEW